jgi:hypothetical protein
VTFPVRISVQAVLLIAFAAFAAVVAFRGIASGIEPPPSAPDFTTVFGPVQMDGQNLSPNEQVVIAMVNGLSCGNDVTKVASDDPSNAPDIGKTVYAISVLADGAGFSQAPGCGTNGDAISFYFPELRRFALETSTFTGVGFKRQELTLGPELTQRQAIPLVTSDGIN